MFSVVVREDRNESELVFEATQVHKHLHAPDSGRVGEVRCDLPDGGTVTYDIRSDRVAGDDQTIFVMNRFGATVAKYHL